MGGIYGVVEVWGIWGTRGDWIGVWEEEEIIADA